MTKRRPWYLKAWRERRGLSGEQLAELASMNKGDISNLETGKRRYNQDHLDRLSAALGCNPKDLLAPPPEDGDLVHLVQRVPEEQKPMLRRMIEGLLGNGNK